MLRFNHHANSWQIWLTVAKVWDNCAPAEARDYFDLGCRVSTS